MYIYTHKYRNICIFTCIYASFIYTQTHTHVMGEYRHGQQYDIGHVCSYIYACWLIHIYIHIYIYIDMIYTHIQLSGSLFEARTLQTQHTDDAELAHE